MNEKRKHGHDDQDGFYIDSEVKSDRQHGMDEVKKARLTGANTNASVLNSTRRQESSLHGPLSSPIEGESSSSSDLPALLDFTHLFEETDIRNRFEAIAHSLINDHLLEMHSFHYSDDECIGDRKESQWKVLQTYKVLEIEFYLRKDRWHEDPYTHGSDEQRVAGQW